MLNTWPPATPTMMRARSVLRRFIDFSSMKSGTMLATLGSSMRMRKADQMRPLNGILWRAKKYAARMASDTEAKVAVTATNTVLAR